MEIEGMGFISEEWHFSQGDRIVVNGKGPNDHSERGRHGTFMEFCRLGCGRMARVVLDPKPEWKDQSYSDIWLLHPESISPEDKDQSPEDAADAAEKAFERRHLR